jgi:hypothetical protein
VPTTIAVHGMIMVLRLTDIARCPTWFENVARLTAVAVFLAYPILVGVWWSQSLAIYFRARNAWIEPLVGVAVGVAATVGLLELYYEFIW